MGMPKRRPQQRWTQQQLDDTVGRMWGAKAEVVDTRRTSGAHADWKMREAVDPLVGLCRGARLPEPVAEYLFHPVRKWRFDYAWPDEKIAVEIEGGIWVQGRHTRGAGFKGDMEKYNAAALLGWRVLRYVPEELHHALPALQELLPV